MEESYYSQRNDVFSWIDSFHVEYNSRMVI